MSQLDVSILQEVVSRAEAAWPDASVFVGRRRGGAGPLPAALVALERVEFDGSTMSADQQTWRFVVSYADRWPSTGSIEEAKISAANALIGELMADAAFGGLGFNPRIELVDFAEEVEDPNDGSFSLSVRFAVDTDVEALV